MSTPSKAQARAEPERGDDAEATPLEGQRRRQQQAARVPKHPMPALVQAPSPAARCYNRDDDAALPQRAGEGCRGEGQRGGAAGHSGRAVGKNQ